MITKSRGSARLYGLLIVMLFAGGTPAVSQTPTEAQRDATRSSCRADYEAHCASVPPGSEASLQCLQKNMPNLSSTCQTTVRAVEPPAAAKAEPAPSGTESSPANAGAATATAGTAAKKPSSAQIAAIRSACRGDYPKICAGVPTGGSAALSCLERNKAKVSSSCQEALGAVTVGMAGSGGTPAIASPGAAAPATLALRPLRPREELFVLRSACGGDVRALCTSVAPGSGRIAECLSARAASLSPACKQVLARFATR